MHAIIVRLPFTPTIITRQQGPAPTVKQRPTSETVCIRRIRRETVLERDGVADLLELKVDVRRAIREAVEDLARLLCAALPHEPPRGLGCEREADEEKDGEDPLERTTW